MIIITRRAIVTGIKSVDKLQQNDKTDDYSDNDN